MNYMHIIALWVLFVVLITIYIIYSIWKKELRLGTEKDFITSYIEKKDNKIKKNDVNMSLNLYLSLFVLCPLLIGIGAFVLSKNALISVICASAGIFIPDGVLIYLKQRENKIFEEKYERTLEQFSSALKAGMSILEAVKEISDNRLVYEPIRNRFKNIYSDLLMGLSVKDAFYNFANSVDSEDAKDVALVLEIQNEVGGKEAEVIMSIANDIHDRMMLRKEIRSIFAGTSYMVWVMDFIPLSIVVILCLTNASYREFYFKGYFILILIGVIMLSLLGSFINHRKIAKILMSA